MEMKTLILENLMEYYGTIVERDEQEQQDILKELVDYGYTHILFNGIEYSFDDFKTNYKQWLTKLESYE